MIHPQIVEHRLLRARNKTENALERYCLQWLLNEDWTYTDSFEDFLEKILQYWCRSGFVSELTYYNQTLAFYSKHSDEINELMYDMLESCGLHSPSQLFREQREKEDPLVLETTNQNLLTWFWFEETIYRISTQLWFIS